MQQREKEREREGGGTQLNPELTLVMLNPFLKTLDSDQLVSFRSLLILKIQVSAKQDKIWEMSSRPT